MPSSPTTRSSGCRCRPPVAARCSPGSPAWSGSPRGRALTIPARRGRCDLPGDRAGDAGGHLRRGRGAHDVAGAGRGRGQRAAVARARGDLDLRSTSSTARPTSPPGARPIDAARVRRRRAGRARDPRRGLRDGGAAADLIAPPAPSRWVWPVRSLAVPVLRGRRAADPSVPRTRSEVLVGLVRASPAWSPPGSRPGLHPRLAPPSRWSWRPVARAAPRCDDAAVGAPRCSAAGSGTSPSPWPCWPCCRCWWSPSASSRPSRADRRRWPPRRTSSRPARSAVGAW